MRALKNVPHRSWASVQEHWLGNIPPDMLPSGVPVEELIRLSGIVLEDKTAIGLVAGVRERTLAEALFLRDKALYCFEACGPLNSSGHSTWTALAMYDACFYAVKAFIYLMGFRDISRSSKFYLELFYEEPQKGGKGVDGHYALKLKERLTHEVLWSVFRRILDTLEGDDTSSAKLKELRKNSYKKFSRDRNFIIYDSYSWSVMDALEESDLYSRVSYVDNVRYIDTAGAVRASYVDQYYRIAHSVINVIDLFVEGLGEYAPAVVDFTSQRPTLPRVNSMLVA